MSAPGQAHWERLFRIAYSLIHQVNSEQSIIENWTFGGGTAMMLQIHHRESDDVDIFLPDAQCLPGQVTRTLSVMESLNPEFVNQAIAQLAIKPKYEAIAKAAMGRAKEILLAV